MPENTAAPIEKARGKVGRDVSARRERTQTKLKPENIERTQNDQIKSADTDPLAARRGPRALSPSCKLTTSLSHNHPKPFGLA
jgi:hypothetical protein